MAVSPFGRYAGMVAAVAALVVLGGWAVGQLRIAGIESSPQLDAAALVVLGAIFGTGAGALTVANGAGRQAELAEKRLDAIGAPSGAQAEHLIAAGTTMAPSPPHITAPSVDVAAERVDVHPDSRP
jgi:hypothetical protein